MEQTLWMVVAALVGVVIPVFLLTVQFAGSANDALAALPTTQVLRARTYSLEIVILSGIIVLHIGMDAMAFNSHAVLYFDFLLLAILISCFGLAFYKLFYLTSNPIEMKRESVEVLTSEIDMTIDDGIVSQRANERLLEDFSQADIPFIYAGSSLFDDAWIGIGPENEFRLLDLDPTPISQVLDALRPIEVEESNPVTAGNHERRPDIFLCGTIGGTLGPRSPLIMVTTDIADGRQVELWDRISEFCQLEVVSGSD